MSASTEPAPECHCGHQLDRHDKYGCLSPSCYLTRRCKKLKPCGHPRGYWCACTKFLGKDQFSDYYRSEQDEDPYRAHQ